MIGQCVHGRQTLTVVTIGKRLWNGVTKLFHRPHEWHKETPPSFIRASTWFRAKWVKFQPSLSLRQAGQSRGPKPLWLFDERPKTIPKMLVLPRHYSNYWFRAPLGHMMQLIIVCKIWGFHGGDYEECCLLGCKSPFRTSQETNYFCVTTGNTLLLSNRVQPVNAM
jgi:hypothetical protein